MVKGSFLCAIAMLGLVSMSRADDLSRMEKIKVEYCSFDEIQHRRAFCDKVTDDATRPTCEDLFSKLVKLCDGHLDKMVVENFKQELLEDLWRQYDLIEDEVAHPLDKTLRTNLERYFGSMETYWDSDYCDTDPAEILDKCHSFVVSYQPIKTFLNFSGRKSLLAVEDETAQGVFQIFEFCKAFFKRYDRKNKDFHLYSD